MFDTNAYATILQACYDVLNNNKMRLGQKFCEGFMYDHDLRNGPGAQPNAQRLFQYVVSEAQRMNNGSSELSSDQLFQVVGNYISYIAEQFQRQQQGQQRMGFGQNSNMFNNNNNVSLGGGGMFQGGNRGMFDNQQARPSPGSYLADDTVQPSNRAASPQTVVPASSSALSFGQNKPDAPSPTVGVSYSVNPLDDIPEQGMDFRSVTNRPIWGDEKAKDRRIIVAHREDKKTNDQRFTVNFSGAFHQQILNDPLDVVKDFFTIAPDSLLSTSFVFRIGYNHLSVIDVPTEDFVNIREKCISALSQDPTVVLHKKITEILNTMQRGPWKAMTTYLVDHINRALYLVRMTTNPGIDLKIGDFEDLDTLLSSSFKHSFTALPEGRHLLEQIVGNAIWNALAMNSDVMFTGKDIPTNAIQSSPAFPFSIESVYPNKYAIPISQEDTAEVFLNNMKTYELSRRTYILSRRAVLITNILGQKVLPKIGVRPSVISNPAAALLAHEAIPYTDITIGKNNLFSEVRPYVSEKYPSEQLEEYYKNPPEDEAREVEVFSRKKPHTFPVDQTVFAIQFGVSPEKYLMALDLFSPLDNQLGQGQVIMAKKAVPSLKVNG